jgi:hypothetical protein
MQNQLAHNYRTQVANYLPNNGLGRKWNNLNVSAVRVVRGIQWDKNEYLEEVWRPALLRKARSYNGKLPALCRNIIL